MKQKLKKIGGLLILGLTLSLTMIGAVTATSYTYTTVTDCDSLTADGTWSSYEAEDVVLDEVDFEEGTGSIKSINVSGVTFTPTSSEDLSSTGQVLSFWIKSTVASTNMTDMGLWLADGDGKMNFYTFSFPADAWTEITVDLASPDTSETPDLSDIAEIQFGWDKQAEEDYTTFNIDDIRKGVEAAPAAPDSTTKTLAEIIPIVLVSLLIFSGAMYLSKAQNINAATIVIFIVSIVIAIACIPILTDIISGL